MKKNKRYILALVIAVILMASVFPAPASAAGNAGAAAGMQAGTVASKEEVVYATLGSNGNVQGIYVVNILDVQNGGEITDYGDYSSVINLTNVNKLTNVNGIVSSVSDTGKFYYQGNCHNLSLPWNITIRYFLDGEEISAGEAAGASGELEIRIETAQNVAVEASFFENYMLQVSVTLDTEKCNNISATGATVANSGKNKLVTFTVMPEAEGIMSVFADVTAFEMDGISFTAVPFSMSITLPDISSMTGGLETLSGAIKQLDDGLVALEAGVKELNEGVAALKDGSADYKEGIMQLGAQSDTIIAASSDINDALAYISTAVSSGMDLSALNDLALLPDSLDSLADGISGISDGLGTLKDGFNTAYTSLDTAISAIPEQISDSDLEALAAANAGSAAFDRLMQTYTAAQTVKAVYSAVSPTFSDVVTTLGSVADSLDTVSSTLAAISTGLSASLSGLDTAAISELSAGIGALAANYSTFHSGLMQYAAGVELIANEYSNIDAGVSALAGGTEETYAGLSGIKSGSGELSLQTQNMPEQIEDSISGILGSFDRSDYIPVSFMSEKNENVTAVQFVLITKEIRSEKSLVQADETIDETFWDRLINLF